MPISIRMDLARRVRYAIATGVITDADILEDYAGVLSDPAYDHSVDEIFDGKDIERLEITSATVWEIAQVVARTDRTISQGARPKVAIVAPSDATFGLARMFQAYREAQRSPKQYLVCRTVDEAHRWLGLPDD